MARFDFTRMNGQIRKSKDPSEALELFDVELGKNDESKMLIIHVLTDPGSSRTQYQIVSHGAEKVQ